MPQGSSSEVGGVESRGEDPSQHAEHGCGIDAVLQSVQKFLEMRTGGSVMMDAATNSLVVKLPLSMQNYSAGVGAQQTALHVQQEQQPEITYAEAYASSGVFHGAGRNLCLKNHSTMRHCVFRAPCSTMHSAPLAEYFIKAAMLRNQHVCVTTVCSVRRCLDVAVYS